MATPITKPVARIVDTRHHGSLVCTITPDGITYRMKGYRKTFLIPHGYAFMRAVDLHAQAERAEKRARRRR